MVEWIIYTLVYFIIFGCGVLLYKFWFYNWQLNCIYHGPKASEITKYIYFDPETQNYYKFGIKMFMCPPSHSYTPSTIPSAPSSVTFTTASTQSTPSTTQSIQSIQSN